MRRVCLVRIYLQWKLFYFFINHFNSLIIMRKLFTTLKSVVAAALVVSMVGVTSCSYDDTDVKNRLDDVEQGLDEVKGDLATLEARVADLEKKVADEVDALKGLIKKQVVVTSVVEENGGITVTLSDGNEFTVYPKTVDTDTDTDTYISVKADETTGVYYWAIFNKDGFVKYLTVGVSDERVPVFQEQEDTCEPIDLKFQVNETTGTIEFSVDGGQTWTDSGVEVGACDCEGTVVSTGACIFKNVVVRDHYVTFTLADGSEVVVFLAELIEFEAGRDHFYVKPGEVKALPFVVNEQVEDISVMNQPMGWKASVELDEDQSAVVEPAQNAYILNIEGPSQEFVNAGYAEKTGAIQLHITTATGACKVVKVGVDLAEITLTVDAEGNITIVNSWRDTYPYTDMWGNTTLIEEYNDAMFVGFLYSDYVTVNGDVEQYFNYDWNEWNIQNASSLFNNMYSNKYQEEAPYIDGEVEVATYETTINEFLNSTRYLYPGHNFASDDSFVFMVIPTDPENNGAPIFENAVIVEYKQIFAIAEEVVESRKTDDVFFNLKLKGADSYRLLWETKASVDDMMSWNPMVKSPADFFDMWYNVSQAGAQYIDQVGVGVAPIVAENKSFAELVNGDPYFTPGTEYYLAIIPVEAGKAKYSADDIVISEFATAQIPTVDVVALSAAARFSSSHSYETLVDFVLPDNNSVTVRFRTGDGGWDNNEYYNRGLNYINIGEWNTYSNKGDSSVWYNAVTFNGEEVDVNGPIVVDYSAKGYSFTFTISGYKVTYVGSVAGLVAPANYDGSGDENEGDENEGGVDGAVELTISGATATVGGNYCDMLFIWDSINMYQTLISFPYGQKPTAGTYTENDMDKSYLVHMYGNTEAKLIDTVKMTISESGVVDVTYTAGGVTYHFSYNGYNEM